MTTTYTYTGSGSEAYPSRDIVARPGFVYDFGSVGAPAESLVVAGAQPSPATKFSNTSNTATDYRIRQASDLPEHPIATGVTAAMTAGAITVADARVTANVIVKAFHKGIGGTAGALFLNTVTAGTGFTIHSTSSTDTSLVYYEILSF